jgi:hypothetical protein
MTAQQCPPDRTIISFEIRLELLCMGRTLVPRRELTLAVDRAVRAAIVVDISSSSGSSNRNISSSSSGNSKLWQHLRGPRRQVAVCFPASRGATANLEEHRM